MIVVQLILFNIFSLIQIINFAIQSEFIFLIFQNIQQMLDWIFGSSQKQKKEQKKKEQKKKESLQFQLSEDQKWVYDFIRQYLTSPIWRNPILDFIEQNCPPFQDSEQNKFEYTKIYQEFQGLATLLLESLIEQTGITERTLEKCIYKGVKNEKDRKIFQQILLCDNFLAFKKIMITKNKELQIEALKKIQSEGFKGNDRIIEIDSKELQRLQIQKAIAMSIAMQEKAKAQQEKQFEEALRMSQKTHQEEIRKIEEMQQKEKKKIEKEKEKQKEKQEKPVPKHSALGPLPPLVIGSRKQFKPIEDLRVDEQNLRKQIEQMKKNPGEQSKQSIQERKRRLMEQRELIKKKKQEERQAQLKTFVQNKQPSVQDSKLDKVSQEELTRRRNLMKKLKEQLKN